MTYQVREAEGSLFANDRKETEAQPDYRGNVRIGGVLYRLAGWKRTGQSGTPWLALKAQPDQRDEAPPHSSAAAPAPAQQREEFSDDIPF